jgi:hypothetical protein
MPKVSCNAPAFVTTGVPPIATATTSALGMSGGARPRRCGQQPERRRPRLRGGRLTVVVLREPRRRHVLHPLTLTAAQLPTRLPGSGPGRGQDPRPKDERIPANSRTNSGVLEYNDFVQGTSGMSVGRTPASFNVQAPFLVVPSWAGWRLLRHHCGWPPQ